MPDVCFQVGRLQGNQPSRSLSMFITLGSRMIYATGIESSILGLYLSCLLLPLMGGVFVCVCLHISTWPQWSGHPPASFPFLVFTYTPKDERAENPSYHTLGDDNLLGGCIDWSAWCSSGTLGMFGGAEVSLCGWLPWRWVPDLNSHIYPGSLCSRPFLLLLFHLNSASTPEFIFVVFVCVCECSCMHVHTHTCSYRHTFTCMHGYLEVRVQS